MALEVELEAALVVELELELEAAFEVELEPLVLALFAAVFDATDGTYDSLLSSLSSASWLPNASPASMCSCSSWHSLHRHASPISSAAHSSCPHGPKYH